MGLLGFSPTIPTHKQSLLLVQRLDESPALNETPCLWIENEEQLWFNPCHIRCPRAQLRAVRDVMQTISVPSVCVHFDFRSLCAQDMWRLLSITTDEERQIGTSLWLTLPCRVHRVNVFVSNAFTRFFVRRIIATCLSEKMKSRVFLL